MVLERLTVAYSSYHENLSTGSKAKIGRHIEKEKGQDTCTHTMTISHAYILSSRRENKLKIRKRL
jgi:hypothetical protein